MECRERSVTAHASTHACTHTHTYKHLHTGIALNAQLTRTNTRTHTPTRSDTQQRAPTPADSSSSMQVRPQTSEHAHSALNVHNPARASGIARQDARSALHHAVIKQSDACVKALLARTDLDCNTKDKVSVRASLARTRDSILTHACTLRHTHTHTHVHICRQTSHISLSRAYANS